MQRLFVGGKGFSEAGFIVWFASCYHISVQFEYRAVNKDGQKINGLKEAASQSALARELREGGYFLVWAKDKNEPSSGALSRDWWNKAVTYFDFLVKHVNLEEKMIFARHLALMIRAGFSLNKALETLARQTTNKYFSSVLTDIAAKVTAGKLFYDSVLDHKDVFPPVFTSMIKVGEASGKLEQTLRLASRHLKRENTLIRKVKGALVYPAVVLAAMVGVGAVMMVFVVPQLAQTFSDLNVPLPLTTQIFFGTANFLKQFWYLAIVILLALIFIIYVFIRKTRTGQKFVNFILLKLPIFSNLTKKLNSARLARTLNSLLSGGIPLTEALKISGESLTNFYYSQAVLAILPEIEKGQQLGKLLSAKPDLFPPVVTEMIAVGEETGSLSPILLELARFFESEVAVATKSLSSVVEPIIMILVGLVVGIFALSIIQPIYSIGIGL